ncbi:lactonase family protein [Sphingomonas sp. Tas61C01]|uniref:lactonase family protein n=1 Tax=Sphingomonas sp. Tas61C01 TaxID=3458297 RepID=UPI00403E4059
MNDWTMTRRAALGAVATASLAGALRGAGEGGAVRLIAGTYAREGGKGLYPVVRDGNRWRVDAPIGGIDDASFGVGGGPAGSYYLAKEGGAGSLGAYGPGWRRRAAVPTGGADPCYLAIDRASACLAIAHYSSGGIAFVRLDPRTGAPGEPIQFMHKGGGPNRDRQTAPHAHWVGFSPDRRWLHAIDLGADRIFRYAFDAKARSLTPAGEAWQAPPGAGPRHLVRHPRLPVAYVVCEMGNVVAALHASADGQFATRQIVSTLPAGFTGASQAGHIAIDRAGRRLYVSNRGHDSIAVFALDAAGAPTLLQHVSGGGRWPRFFLLLEDQRQVMVANERSGTLDLLALQPDGRLAATGERLSVPGVAFLGVVGA